MADFACLSPIIMHVIIRFDQPTEYKGQRGGVMPEKPFEFRLRPKELEIDARNPFADDLFNREVFADALTAIIRKARADDKRGLVIAVDGSWGIGKTTFISQWKAKITGEKDYTQPIPNLSILMHSPLISSMIPLPVLPVQFSRQSVLKVIWIRLQSNWRCLSYRSCKHLWAIFPSMQKQLEKQLLWSCH